jgi:uncharacterized membrane protein
MKLLDILRGAPGHPTHPPMTGITLGAYTLGTWGLALGALGFSVSDMAIVGFWSTVAGLCFGLVAIVTGTLDFVTIPSGTPLQRRALAHMVVQVIAAVLYAVSVIFQGSDYQDAVISTPALALAAAGWITVVAGAWLGGTLVYRMGMRVEPADAKRSQHAERGTGTRSIPG